MDEFYFTGNDLIEMGFTPGPHFGPLLKDMNKALADTKGQGQQATDNAVAAVIAAHKAEHDAQEAARKARVRPLHAVPVPIVLNLTPKNKAEQDNLDAVWAAMSLLARTPTVEAVAIMPDACPAGVISVGGVAAARNALHPAWHSADICCSMYATNFGKIDPKTLLDAVFKLTHFGPGGRNRANEVKLPAPLLDWLLNANNPYVANPKAQAKARSHMMTQGDGNHFAFVGISEKTGDTWLITHHGSRGLGDQVYRAGMEVAEKFRQEICPDLDKGHAWIPYDTQEGKDYWEALCFVRAWTKTNHESLHAAALAALDVTPLHQRWNPHNFVFVDPADPTLFWHAKGATPIHNAFLEDTDGTQIIPLNMAEPILFVQGEKTERSLGFAPHGAGRNMSRTQHKKTLQGESDIDVFKRETAGIDARFFSGKIDVSELPSAYKDAQKVQDEMAEHGLATVVDRIMPYGAIMAGEQEPFWLNKKNKKSGKKAEEMPNIEPQADSTD